MRPQSHALVEPVVPAGPHLTDYTTGCSAKLREYQMGNVLVELPWRVVKLIGAIGRDPALFAHAK